MYTKIAKPTSSVYTDAGFVTGKQPYDDSGIEYDESTVNYDGIDDSLYTKRTKPTSSVYTKITKPS